MDSLLFILVLACLVLVAGWYIGNEMAGRKGDWGLLAIIAALREKRAPDAARYRVKKRQPDEARPGVGEDPDAAYKPAQGPRRFHDKDDPAYRSRGPLPKFGERAGNKTDEPQ